MSDIHAQVAWDTTTGAAAVVAVIDQTDTLASFFNWGASRVDLAAPEVGILSTVPNNEYGVVKTGHR